MKNRCKNKSHSAYKNYGGRGIKVCFRWLKYDNFLKDMGFVKDNLTIDRINNDKDYEPGNCRWVSQMDQMNNMRRNRHINHNGQILTLAQWGRKIGIKSNTIFRRLERHWSLERALSSNKFKTNRK